MPVKGRMFDDRAYPHGSQPGVASGEQTRDGQQLAAKSPGAGKLLVALTREQAAHAAAIIDGANDEDGGSCDCCRDTVAALEAALEQRP
jgi:hypothetical protein